MSGIEFTSYMRYRMAPRFAARHRDARRWRSRATRCGSPGGCPRTAFPQAQLRQLGRAARLPSRHGDGGGGRRDADAGARPRRAQGDSVSAERFPIPRDRYLPCWTAWAGWTSPAWSATRWRSSCLPASAAARVENGELVLAPGERRQTAEGAADSETADSEAARHHSGGCPVARDGGPLPRPPFARSSQRRSTPPPTSGEGWHGRSSARVIRFRRHVVLPLSARNEREGAGGRGPARWR